MTGWVKLLVPLLGRRSSCAAQRVRKSSLRVNISPMRLLRSLS
jgi:hypothetical protein